MTLYCVCREFLGPIVGGGLTHFINFQDSALVSAQCHAYYYYYCTIVSRASAHSPCIIIIILYHISRDQCSSLYTNKCYLCHVLGISTHAGQIQELCLSTHGHMHIPNTKNLINNIIIAQDVTNFLWFLTVNPMQLYGEVLLALVRVHTAGVYYPKAFD